MWQCGVKIFTLYKCVEEISERKRSPFRWTESVPFFSVRRVFLFQPLILVSRGNLYEFTLIVGWATQSLRLFRSLCERYKVKSAFKCESTFLWFFMAAHFFTELLQKYCDIFLANSAGHSRHFNDRKSLSLISGCLVLLWRVSRVLGTGAFCIYESWCWDFCTGASVNRKQHFLV